MNAIISDCGLYRYRLERQCVGPGQTAIIMVNPSTADAAQDDATIRKLRGFGDRHRWGRIVIGNLFAYRATDVRELAQATDPVGPLTDEHLLDIIAGANQVICAWGPVTKQPKSVRTRWRAVWSMIDEVAQQAYSIGAPAKCGNPKHPLMLSYAEPIIRWEPRP